MNTLNGIDVQELELHIKPSIFEAYLNLAYTGTLIIQMENFETVMKEIINVSFLKSFEKENESKVPFGYFFTNIKQKTCRNPIKGTQLCPGESAIIYLTIRIVQVM